MNTRPLGILHTVSLSESQTEKLTEIEALKIPFVWERLRMEGRDLESEEPLLEREFKRFLALIVLERKPLAMIGPKLDEVWHQFILFTSRYAEFCRRIFGEFIHHQPNTETTPVPREAWDNFMVGYRKHFGDIPSIWTDGMDADALAYFQGREGGFPSKWSGWTGFESDITERRQM